MKKITLWLFALFSCWQISAQVSAYSFSESTEVYAQITGTTSTAVGDDGLQNAIPIGFNFVFGGASYSTFSISTNGIIKLGGTIVDGTDNHWTNTLTNGTQVNKPFIAPFWDDNHLSTGEIRYSLTGTAPNQVLSINWHNTKIGSTGSTAGASVSTILRLYESTNVIEMVYSSPFATINTVSASVGLNDMTSFLSVTPAATSTVSSTTANNSINATVMANLAGKKFTFTPPACSSPSGLVTANITAYAADVSWEEPAFGSTEGYEYVLSTTNTVPSGAGTPTSDTFVLFDTLTPETTYYLFVRSNCGADGFSNWASRSFTTTVACPAPTTGVSSGLTTSAATLGWTSVGTSFEINWGTGTFTAGAGANTETGVSGTSFTFPNNLTQNTTYRWFVRRNCDVDGFSTWAGPYTFTTLCSAVATLPYTENFDTYGTGSTAFPSCWARPVINSGYPSIVNVNAAPLSTVNSLRFQSAVNTPTYAISPAFAEDIHNLRVKFSLRREGANSGTIDIGVMSNPSDLSTFEVVQTINPSDNIFNAYTFDLDGTTLAGENNYIAVRHNSILGNWYYWLDNFVVELIPACPDQTGLVVGNITATGADFSWDDMSSVGDVTYEYAITTSATPPASGEPTEDTFHIATNELTPQTVYYLHVRVVCDTDSFGNWATSAPFTTLCVPFTNLPYTENFDTSGTGSNAFPSCWSRPVIYSGYPSIVAANPVSAPNSLRFQSDVGVPTYAISPAFAEDIHNLRVKFSLKREGPNSGTIDIGVMSNPSDLSTFEVVQTINPANDNHTAYIFNLSATALTGVNRYVAIRHNTILNNWYYWVDNFVVELIPACADQTGLVVGNISATGAEMSWDNMSVNGYEYAVTTSATPPTSGTFTTATFYEAINNLDPLTVYYLHVRTDCGNGDFGIWVSTSFKTLCLPPNITGTTPGAVCGQGSVALSATSDNGTIAWYAAQTGGVALSTGATFNTPVITGTTSYWVAAFAGQNGVGGRLAPASTAGTTPSTYGLVFTATNDFTLNTVDVYLRGTSAGNLVVNLTNNSGTVLDTRTIAVPAGNATTPVQHTIELNFNITPGTYRLLAISGPDMVRESALGGYPYPVGDVASITDGYILGTSTAYYYFYNWAYTSGCASPRTEVVATVTTAPVLTLSDASVTVCDGNPSDAITVTAGSSDYDVFAWQPATNVSGDATNGWTFTATESGVYTLTASNSVTGCVSTKDVTIVAGQSPVLNMPEELSACSGNVTELNSGVNNISAEFINETFSGGTTFPSGWTAVVGAGDAVAVVNANTAGGTANEVKITGNSQTANVTNRVYYGPINTSGLSELTLQWNNYLYHYQATYNYSVRIQTSSDGVTWNDTNWVFSPVTATQAASVVQTTIATSDVGSSTFYVSFTNQGQTFGMHNWNIDNVILSGEVNHEVTWSPATNLYTDAAGTIPYVGGTNAPIVYFLGNGGSYSYTASSASSTGCQTSESIDVTVTDAPDAPAALSPQTLNGGQTLADLVVTATGSLTWYSDAGLTNQISSTTEAVDGTTYYVTQTVGSCTSDATPITVDVNLGNGNFDSVIFKVYPNPTKNILNISCNQDISSIEVYNMVGQRVNNMVLNANEGKIDMSNLASGAYFVKVTSNDATKTVKVIKE